MSWWGSHEIKSFLGISITNISTCTGDRISYTFKFNIICYWTKSDGLFINHIAAANENTWVIWLGLESEREHAEFMKETKPIEQRKLDNEHTFITTWLAFLHFYHPQNRLLVLWVATSSQNHGPSRADPCTNHGDFGRFWSLGNSPWTMGWVMFRQSMFHDQRSSIISGRWCNFTILKKIMKWVNGVGMTSHIWNGK